MVVCAGGDRMAGTATLLWDFSQGRRVSGWGCPLESRRMLKNSDNKKKTNQLCFFLKESHLPGREGDVLEQGRPWGSAWDSCFLQGAPLGVPPGWWVLLRGPPIH